MLCLAALLLPACQFSSERAPDLWRGGYSFELDTAASPPLLLPPSSPAPPPTGSLKQSGQSVDVWAAVDTLHKCGRIDVPDIPARAYQDAKGLTHMIVDSTGYTQMNGNSILMNGSASRLCTASWNETKDPDPAHFAGDEFLDSPIAFENGTVVALVHTEYPGGVYNLTRPNENGPQCAGLAPDGSGKTKNYPYCWTVTVGLAISHDFGNTWSHAKPPPHHLVAAVPYKYNQNQLAYGWGDPSNIIKHPKEDYYYAAIWNRNQVGLQAPGICMIRTNNLMDPASWRAWDGKAYTKSLSASPYTLKPGTEGDHVCTVTNLPAGSCVHIANKTQGCQAAGIAWSTYLEKFVVTLGCGSYFSWATSDDLITWSEPVKFDLKAGLSPSVSKMVRGMNYPTFMDPTAPTLGDKNFYTIGQKPYLFWASIGHSPYTDGRHQWATPFTFEK